jgi:transcriptional regulator with XRE-family HTH domain
MSTILVVENSTILVDARGVIQKPKHPNKISEIRLDRGLSQEKLAQLTHTTNQQIGRLEMGTRRLTYEWMVRLAEALECHWSELATDDSSAPNKTEQGLLKTFRNLDQSHQETLLDMAGQLADSPSKPYKHKK